MRTKIRRRPNGRWYLFSVDDAEKEHSHGGYRTQREAKAAAAALRTDAARGRYVARSKLAVAAYLLDEWLPARDNADLSATTRDTDRTVVEAWIVPHIGDVSLQKLSARDLDGLYRTLRERGGRGGRPLRGKSVRNVHVTLSKALGDAVRRGYLAVNPVLAVDPPARDDSVERTAWTREEVRSFLEVAATDRLHAIWRLALATGLRRGELLGLTWDNVQDGSIHVRRQVLVRPRAVPGVPRIYVRETLKNRRSRRVRLDDQTASHLRRWKAEQNEDRLAFGEAWKAEGGVSLEADWIVTEADGAVVHPDTLLGRWKRLVKQAGVTPIGLHGARHSYAEIALGAGVRLDVVSRNLGHASSAFTADQYSHDSDAAAVEAAEIVGRVIGARWEISGK
jgi:integrase